MLGIFSVIIGEILFSFIVLKWKDLRKKDVSPLANLALLSFSIPFFVVLWFVLDGSRNFNFSPEYFLYLSFWLIPVLAENLGSVYLIKYQGLLEKNAYELGFSTLIAIFADILFLNTSYSIYTWVAIILFLSSGYLLTRSRLKTKIPFGISLVILLALSVLGVAEYTLYKQAMLLQNTLLLHVVVAQGAFATAFLLFGYRPLLKGIRNKNIRMRDIAFITVLFCPFSVLEAFGLSQVPVSIFILSTIFPMLIYSAYDTKTSEVRVTPKTIVAFVGAILGIILMNL